MRNTQLFHTTKHNTVVIGYVARKTNEMYNVRVHTHKMFNSSKKYIDKVEYMLDGLPCFHVSPRGQVNSHWPALKLPWRFFLHLSHGGGIAQSETKPTHH